MLEKSIILSGRLRQLIFCTSKEEIDRRLTEIGIEKDDTIRIKFLYDFLDYIDMNSYGNQNADDITPTDLYSVVLDHFFNVIKIERNRYK